MTVAYLIASISLALLGALACMLAARHRRLVLASGLLHVLCAPWAILFVPDYWNPSHLLPMAPGVGFEDLVFCFGCGTLSWYAAIWRSPILVNSRSSAGQAVLRFLATSAIAAAFVFVLVAAGVRIMPAVVIGFSILGALLVAAYPGSWRLACRGAAGFAALYGLFVTSAVVVCPDALHWWRGGPQFEAVLFGEVLWAVSFGAVWPLIVVHALDAEIVDAKYADVHADLSAGHA